MIRFAFPLLLALTVAAIATAQTIDVRNDGGDDDMSTFGVFQPIAIKHKLGSRVQVIPWGTANPSFLPEKHVVRQDECTIFCAPPGFYMINADGMLRFAKIEGEMPEPPKPPKPPDDPVNPKIPAPSAALQSAVASIKAKLSTDPDKSKRVSWCFAGFSEAMRGKAGMAIKDSAKFGAVSAATLQDLDMGTGVSIGAEIENAMVNYVGFKREGTGFQNVPLTADMRNKIADLYLAIAWAGQQ